jgi:hypothetical protein
MSFAYHNSLPVRCTHQKIAIYGFMDASSIGHGSSFALPDKSLLFCHGVWGRSTDDLSSNFWELCNLVELVDEAVFWGELCCKLFIFTNNTTAEGGYYRGDSDNKILFSLIFLFTVG